MTPRPVVLVGGAGDMAAVVARRLLAMRRDVRATLADRDVERARRRARALGDERAAVEPLDLFDGRALRAAVRGAALVVNASGPYVRTGVPVLEACIDERVDYLDLGDDLEAADTQLAYDRVARERGVTALIGAGVAPGTVNVAARRMADRLDEVRRVRVAWVTGSTPTRDGDGDRAGRAVLEHMLHSCVGVTATVRGGARVLIPAFRRGEVVAFPPPLGPTRVYDLGHAEIATIPRAFPEVREVRSQGALAPAALNGVFQGIARLVSTGALGWEEALDALVALDAGRGPGRRAAVGALAGVAALAARGELPRRELRAAAALLAGREGPPPVGGLRVDVAGERNGRPSAWTAAAALRQDAAAGGMDEVTGAPCAVFASLLLDGRVRTAGVVPPEIAVDPDDFERAVAPLRIPGASGLLSPVPAAPA